MHIARPSQGACTQQAYKGALVPTGHWNLDNGISMPECSNYFPSGMQIQSLALGVQADRNHHDFVTFYTQHDHAYEANFKRAREFPIA